MKIVVTLITWSLSLNEELEENSTPTLGEIILFKARKSFVKINFTVHNNIVVKIRAVYQIENRRVKEEKGK
jgi:hypothetical protein